MPSHRNNKEAELQQMMALQRDQATEMQRLSEIIAAASQSKELPAVLKNN
jgi:hypothetical protein